MTTLIAIQQDDDVLFGWDSQATQGNEATEQVAPKVFANEGIVFAVTGVARAADLLEVGEFPQHGRGDIRRWIIGEWVPVARELFRGEAALFNEDKGCIRQFGFLMAVNGVVFEMDDLLNPSRSREGIYTMGSGAAYAKGAALLSQSWGQVAEDIAFDALWAADKIDPYTGGPMTVRLASQLMAD